MRPWGTDPVPRIPPRWSVRYNGAMDQHPLPSPAGRLVVISGPSGVGKSTLLRQLLERLPQLVPSVSATTRPPRAGERDGIDYHFLSLDDFERRRETGQFLECCRVYGRQHWYGTLVDEVVPRLAAGQWVVLEIDVEGTLSILSRFPAAETIFVMPPRRDELEHRLRLRGTESAEAMARRLEVAHRELDHADRYRHRVVNDDVTRAVDEVIAILRAAGLPPVAGPPLRLDRDAPSASQPSASEPSAAHPVTTRTDHREPSVGAHP